MATLARSWLDSGYRVELPIRLKRFVWLATGMFSASSLTMGMLGYYFVAPTSHLGTNFVAAVGAACLFWIATRMKFGPASA